MYKTGLLVNLPSEANNKYEEDLLALVRAISFLINESLVSNDSFEDDYKKLVKIGEFNSDFENRIKLIESQIAIELKFFLKKITHASISTDKFNYKAVEKSLNGIKKSVPTIQNIKVRNEIKMWVSENVRLIKTIPEQMLTKVEEIVYTAIRTGLSYKELSKQLIDSFSIPKKRAVIIARDQINKLSGNLTRARNLELGIAEYKWLTSRDDRVRHSHEVMEGMICSWKNVDVYKTTDASKKWLQRSSIGGTINHPSRDVLCRCTSIPIIKI